MFCATGCSEDYQAATRVIHSEGYASSSRQAVKEAVQVAVSKARQAVIAGVKAHAQAHYTDGGWDVIVECWSDDQILEATRGSRTVNGAVKMLEGAVSVWADAESEARSYADHVDPPQPTREQMIVPGCLDKGGLGFSEAHEEHMRINGDCPWCCSYDTSKWVAS